MIEADYLQLFRLLRYSPANAIMPEQDDWSLDWPRLLQQAAIQEILPLLYGQARLLPSPLHPPAEILQRLRTTYLHSVARHARIFHGLALVLAALRDAEIPVIVLKGAHLASLVYREPAYRMMVDVDLLIRSEHLGPAREALFRIGCQQHSLPLEEESGWHHEHYDFPLMRVGIEMHWTLNRHDGRVSLLDLDDVWDRAHPATIAGVETLVLAPEDLYVYLCQHIYFHGLRVRLRHLLDLAECVRKYQYDDQAWANIRQRAADWRIERVVAILTHIVREWCCPQIPSIILDSSVFPEGERGTALIAYAKQAVLQGDIPDNLPVHLARLLGHRRLHEKIAILRGKLFLSKAALAHRYNCPSSSPRLFLLYIMHPLQLFSIYGLRVFRIFRHPRTLTADLAHQTALLDWLEGFD